MRTVERPLASINGARSHVTGDDQCAAPAPRNRRFTIRASTAPAARPRRLPGTDHSIAGEGGDLPDKTEEKQPGPAFAHRKPRFFEGGGEITEDCLILVNR